MASDTSHFDEAGAGILNAQMRPVASQLRSQSRGIDDSLSWSLASWISGMNLDEQMLRGDRRAEDGR